MSLEVNASRSPFVSAQIGDSIKTIEEHYAKYMRDADSVRDLVESQVRESAKSVQSGSKANTSPTPLERKSPRFPKGLKVERVIGVEPTTLCLASIRSSQLSYTRIE